MKRLNNELFDRISNIENLREAHKNARKGKTHYAEVKMVDKNLDFYLNKIKLMLEEDAYQVSKYRVKKFLIKQKKEKYSFYLISQTG